MTSWWRFENVSDQGLNHPKHILVCFQFVFATVERYDVQDKETGILPKSFIFHFLEQFFKTLN